MLLWILTHSCSEKQVLGEEAERQLVKLQVTILSTLGNMATSHQEYAAVIVNAGCEKVLEKVAIGSKKADHYEVTAAVRDVNTKLQQVTWTRTKSHSINKKGAAPPIPPPPPAKVAPPSVGNRPPPPLVPQSSKPTQHHPSSKNIFNDTLTSGASAEEEDIAESLPTQIEIDKISSANKNNHTSVIRRPSKTGGEDGEPLMGYLRKQGGGTSLLGRKSWKTRFFVLDGPVLFYYENEEARVESKPLNPQPYIISFCDVLLDDKAGIDNTKYYFTIKPCGSRGGKGPLVLEAETAAMRARWLTWLNTAQKIQAPANW